MECEGEHDAEDQAAADRHCYEMRGIGWRERRDKRATAEQEQVRYEQGVKGVVDQVFYLQLSRLQMSLEWKRIAFRGNY